MGLGLGVWGNRFWNRFGCLLKSILKSVEDYEYRVLSESKIKVRNRSWKRWIADSGIEDWRKESKLSLIWKKLILPSSFFLLPFPSLRFLSLNQQHNNVSLFSWSTLSATVHHYGPPPPPSTTSPTTILIANHCFNRPHHHRRHSPFNPFTTIRISCRRRPYFSLKLPESVGITTAQICPRRRRSDHNSHDYITERTKDGSGEQWEKLRRRRRLEKRRWVPLNIDKDGREWWSWRREKERKLKKKRKKMYNSCLYCV